MKLDNNVKTTFTDFVNEWGTGLKPYKGFYRKELSSDSFDIWVENSYYDPKSGAIEFECELNTMNGELAEKEFIIRIKKGGVIEYLPNPEVDAWVEQSGTKPELDELVKLVNRRPVAAAAVGESLSPEEYEEKMSMTFDEDGHEGVSVDESLNGEGFEFVDEEEGFHVLEEGFDFGDGTDVLSELSIATVNSAQDKRKQEFFKAYDEASTPEAKQAIAREYDKTADLHMASRDRELDIIIGAVDDIFASFKAYLETIKARLEQAVPDREFTAGVGRYSKPDKGILRKKVVVNAYKFMNSMNSGNMSIGELYSASGAYIRGVSVQPGDTMASAIRIYLPDELIAPLSAIAADYLNACDWYFEGRDKVTNFAYAEGGHVINAGMVDELPKLETYLERSDKDAIVKATFVPVSTFPSDY